MGNDNGTPLSSFSSWKETARSFLSASPSFAKPACLMDGSLTVVVPYYKRDYLDPSLASLASQVDSHAYIAHHWEQREIRFPFLRVCDAFLRLQVKRRLPSARWSHKEGIAEWEFWSICRLAFQQQYRRERRRPRHYWRRKGL
jgi:hypothetical protein